MSAPTTMAIVQTINRPTMKSWRVVSTSDRLQLQGAGPRNSEDPLHTVVQAGRQLVARDQNCTPGSLGGLAPPGELEELGRCAGREPVERLLEDQQRGVEREGAGERRPAALLL